MLSHLVDDGEQHCKKNKKMMIKGRNTEMDSVS